MIEKEKKSIENLKNLVQLRKDKTNTIKYDTCICSTKELDIALNLVQKQQAEIEKMTNYITSKNYTDDICEFRFDVKGRFHKHCYKGECKECIKQYFEKQVESEDK